MPRKRRDLDRQVAEVLKAWITQSGRSNRAVAKAAGMSEGNLRKIIGGEDRPATGESMTLGNVEALLAGLDRSWAELMEEVGTPASGRAVTEIRRLRRQVETLLAALERAEGGPVDPELREYDRKQAEERRRRQEAATPKVAAPKKGG